MVKLNFKQSLLQSSVSCYPSEIIISAENCCAAKYVCGNCNKVFIIQYFNIVTF